MSVVAHLCLLVGVFVSGIWRIERMDRGRVQARIDGWHPPPPPAPSGSLAVKTEFVNHPKRPHVVKGTVQPVVQPPEPPHSDSNETLGTGTGSGDATATGTCTENCGEAPAPPADPVCGNGSLEGSEQCDDGNTRDGDGCSSTCRTEPKRPQAVGVVPSVLAALRISGETQVHPSATTQSQMMREGVSRVEAVIKLCLDTSGHVASARMMRSTRYTIYDQSLLEAVRDWRYQPYTVNGTPVPACSTVAFVYTIH